MPLVKRVSLVKQELLVSRVQLVQQDQPEVSGSLDPMELMGLQVQQEGLDPRDKSVYLVIQVRKDPKGHLVNKGR